LIRRLDPAQERCWIAEKDGENVGAVFLEKKSSSGAKLRSLLVEPSVRGPGMGKRRVEECVRFARYAGYQKIMPWPQSELVAARRLYQNAGLAPVAEEKHQSWSCDDRVAETWELNL
jgi:predicted N-acetyltransferase YhbS